MRIGHRIHLVRKTAYATTLVCSLLVMGWASDELTCRTVDFGWLRVIEEGKGWRVVRSYEFPIGAEAILPGDLIIAIDGQKLSSRNAISAAALLDRIRAGASVVEVERGNALRMLRLYPAREPLLKSLARFQLRRRGSYLHGRCRPAAYAQGCVR